MAENTKIEVDPGKVWQKALKEAQRKVKDLSPVLDIIGRSWFQSNKAIFDISNGPGKWADLKESTKDKKERYLGFIYPVFRGATQHLEGSITQFGAPGSIMQIKNGNELSVGTSVAYAEFLQKGTKNMKARPFVLVGAEQTGPPEFNVRLAGWVFQLQRFVADVTGEEIGKKK